MFRLKVSHHQALTSFLLPDAYNCGIHLVKTISKRVLFIKCVIYRLCLNIKRLKVLNILMFRHNSVNDTLYKQNQNLF